MAIFLQSEWSDWHDVRWEWYYDEKREKKQCIFEEMDQASSHLDHHPSLDHTKLAFAGNFYYLVVHGR